MSDETTINDEQRRRIQRALPYARAAAATVGPLHSAWDAIFDAEAYMSGRPVIVGPESVLAVLERYLPESQ